MADAAIDDIGKLIGNAANIGVLILGWAIHRIISSVDRKIEQIDRHLESTDSSIATITTQIAVIHSKEKH